ncbi:MAG: protein kinase [Anaerolineaceae bacterium]
MTPPGILNDRYQLVESLGTGGMALVYKAKDLMLERYVAVKLLREDFSVDAAFRERFRQEAKAAANLSHPNIVTVHDFGLDQRHLFIVMELVPGTDLKTRIREKGRFEVQEALDLMVQACQGVGYAHRAGLVHCDIKPHNILVSLDGRVKVTDFGIARALATISPEERSDVVWGSPLYFSPEQAAGLPPSPASDVYSLGVILYEMLTGQLPFNSADASELARMHREVQPVAPRVLNPDIPKPLEDIILKVLSKEPAARYRTADQFGRLLAGLQSLKNGSAQAQSGTIPSATAAPSQAAAPAQTPAPTETSAYPGSPDTLETETPEKNSPDWGTLLLWLVAGAAMFGLIPFWLYVYLTLRP